MRITCPNCNAQYEVADDMIPSGGRDVQCSNCGTTWFQDGRARQATAAEERAVRRPGRRAPEAGTDAAAPEAAPNTATPEPRRMAEGDTRDILQAERDREDRIRARAIAAAEAASSASETDPIAPSAAAEADPEEDGDPRERAAAERARMAAAATVARARDDAVETDGPDHPLEAEPPAPPDADTTAPDDGTDDAIAEALRDAAATDDGPYDDPAAANAGPDAGDLAGAAPVAARTTRRELLPDIEEINSSLRPDERTLEAEAAAAAAADHAQMAPPARSGFRIGFLTVGLVILAFVGVYIFADAIAAAVPQAAAALDGYVSFVDAQRIALETGAEALVDRIAPDA
ncbi:zinc-ribbon domain-containing protein [uncultured Jannaschia sp.]|uniref:zinc-ribbon domain-containing protein n=1 Tax=uncultured Jannaschia sp. TaxID=293347 RepID=UPI002607E26C|nr:zinc-ribbon domain-containing protein [uncultured Jannaschia sp.]